MYHVFIETESKDRFAVRNFLALLEKIKASSMGKTEGEKGLMNRPVSCRPCFVAGRYIANAMYSLSKQCVTIGSKERECQME